MCSKPAAEQNSAAVTPWRVVHVVAESNYRLRVRFVDGVEGVVDLAQIVFAPKAGVFGALADEAVFSAVHIEHGAVTWPGEIDLAPDAMHREIKEHGRWAPRLAA